MNPIVEWLLLATGTLLAGILAAVTGFGGVQLILLGVIGEYLGRIYAETKRRPLFLLRESSEGPRRTPITVELGPDHDAHLHEKR